MIEITYGYSRDHRPNLKQFVMNLICVGDGDIPVLMEIAPGNQFFASSVFLKSPKRIAALGMIMSLCLLVYNLGQRQLRQALAQKAQTIPDQLGKSTATPTLRWVFQCFMAVHLVVFQGVQQVVNLTDERWHILQFFSEACRRYYLIPEPDS